MSTDKLTGIENTAEDLLNSFTRESDRVKYISNKYAKTDIAQAFAAVYGKETTNVESTKFDVVHLKVGEIYKGQVREINRRGIIFDIPGVKDEVVCRENILQNPDAINAFLETHDNMLEFEVREKQKDRFIVSVLNAYYKKWDDDIQSCIKHRDGIAVHIESIVRGGYICKTNIWTLTELTGTPYTSLVFIPGSQIVLNIEKSFERWVGQDVVVIPQNFIDYRTDFRNNCVERSLVCSRKKVLQFYGIQNMYNLYQYMTTTAPDDIDPEQLTFDGTVTGIINSSKKIGAFVELGNDMYITGLLPLDSLSITDYPPGTQVKVRVKELEVQEGQEPFIIKKLGKNKQRIVKSNVRAVFELVG